MNPLLVILAIFLALVIWCVFRIANRVRGQRRSEVSEVKKVLRDWMAYVGVACLVLVTIFIVVVLDVNADAMEQLVTPVLAAAFGLGCPAKEFWRYSRSVKFWVLLFALAAAHFGFFYFVMTPAWRGNPLLIIFVGLPEMFVAYIANAVMFEVRKSA